MFYQFLVIVQGKGTRETPERHLLRTRKVNSFNFFFVQINIEELRERKKEKSTKDARVNII